MEKVTVEVAGLQVYKGVYSCFRELRCLGRGCFLVSQQVARQAGCCVGGLCGGRATKSCGCERERAPSSNMLTAMLRGIDARRVAEAIAQGVVTRGAKAAEQRMYPANALPVSLPRSTARLSCLSTVALPFVCLCGLS